MNPDSQDINKEGISYPTQEATIPCESFDSFLNLNKNKNFIGNNYSLETHQLDIQKIPEEKDRKDVPEIKQSLPKAILEAELLSQRKEGEAAVMKPYITKDDLSKNLNQDESSLQDSFASKFNPLCPLRRATNEETIAVKKDISRSFANPKKIESNKADDDNHSLDQSAIIKRVSRAGSTYSLISLLRSFEQFVQSFDPKKIDFGNRLGEAGSSIFFPYHEVDNNANEWVVLYEETYEAWKIMWFLPEVVVASKCRHPNILTLKACYVEVRENGKWYLFFKLPRMETNLKSRKDSNPFDRKEIVKYFYGIILGLEYLHQNEIAHRNIKPSVVFLDKNNTVKLADYGIATIIDGKNFDPVKTYAGTRIYMAPEIKFHKEIKNGDLYKVDMWSVGVTMAELCLGLEFDLMKNSALSGTIQEKFFHWKLSEQQRIDAYSQDLLDLIKALIQENPDLRPNAQQVRKTLEAKFSDILGIQIQQNEENKNENEQNEMKEPQSDNHIDQIPQENKEENLESQSEEKIEEPMPTNQIQPASIEKIDEKAKLEEMKALEEYLNESFDGGLKFRADQQKFVIEPDEPDAEVNNISLTNLLAQMDEFKGGETYRNLKELALRLTDCQNNLFQGISQIVAALCKDCKDLTLLELNFWKSKTSVNDALIRHVAQQIGRNLTNLKELELNFSACDQITPFCINYISLDIISNLPQLKKFQLKLSECIKVTDDSVREIFINIERNLLGKNTLVLHIEENEFKDDTIAYQKVPFASLKGLTHLLPLLLRPSSTKYSLIDEIKTMLP